MRTASAIVFLSCVTFALGQTQATTGGTVQGRIVSAQNGEGISRAEVILGPARINQATAAPARNSYSTEADARGNFSFTGIPPGQYQVTASHPRYGREADNQFPDPSLIPQFSLASGQTVTGVTVRLTPLGVVAGRILDSDGDPISGVEVEALQSAYQRGIAQLRSNKSVPSNDRGEYRLFGLFPGTYFIRATPTNLRNVATGDVRGPQPPPPFAATFFGDTGDQNRAAPVEVQGNGELLGIDIHLQRDPVYSVKGRLSTGAARDQRRPVGIQIQRRPNQDRMMPGITTQIRENEYEISRLQPGTYVITARLADPENNGKQLVARQFVEIVNRDLDGIDLNLSAGEEVSGVATAAGSPPTDLASQSIVLQPVEPGGGSFSAPVGADGKFTIYNIIPDLYRVRVDSPGGAYIKSLKVGDQELADRQLDLKQGGAGSLAIVLSREKGQVSGKVTDAEGKPVVSANVTLVPDQSKPDWTDRYTNMLTDSEGRYFFRNANPGSYRVYAWKDAARGAPQDATFRKPFEQFGMDILVEPSKQILVDLRAIVTQPPPAKPQQ